MLYFQRDDPRLRITLSACCPSPSSHSPPRHLIASKKKGKTPVMPSGSTDNFVQLKISAEERHRTLDMVSFPIERYPARLVICFPLL